MSAEVKDSGEPWHPTWLGLDPIEDVEDGILLGQDQFEALLNAETGYLRDLDNEVISTSRRYETAAMSGTGQLVAIGTFPLPLLLHLAINECTLPERDTHNIYYFPSLSDALSPTYVPTILLNPSSSPILQLVAGASHFLFLTSTSVLSYGDNRFSQCGTHSSVPVSTISLSIIDFFEGLQPTTIAAGDLHSCVITNGGALYTFGADMTGQCGGFGGEPTLVNLKPDEEDEDPDEVISVACGSQHTVLVTTLGQVWSSGLSESSYPSLALLESTTDAELRRQTRSTRTREYNNMQVLHSPRPIRESRRRNRRTTRRERSPMFSLDDLHPYLVLLIVACPQTRYLPHGPRVGDACEPS